MTVDPIVPLAINALTSPSRDVATVDLTVKAAHTLFSITRVEFDLVGELTSSDETHKYIYL